MNFNLTRPSSIVPTRAVLFASALLLLGQYASTARAVPIVVGQTIFSVAEPDPTGGVLIAGGVPVPFVSPTLKYSGTLTSSVIAGDPSNTLGGLTFTYLLTNDLTSINALSRLTVTKFTGFLTNVSYQPGPGVAPTVTDRLSADVIGNSFIGTPVGAGAILPGGTGMLLVVQTDALIYQPALASVIDGDITSVLSFAPLPEPSSMVLAGFGAAGLLALAHKRRRARRS